MDLERAAEIITELQKEIGILRAKLGQTAFSAPLGRLVMKHREDECIRIGDNLFVSAPRHMGRCKLVIECPKDIHVTQVKNRNRIHR